MQEAGRLLYARQDDWVHINCALWSAEVYEEGDGSLQMVHLAIARGRKLVTAAYRMFCSSMHCFSIMSVIGVVGILYCDVATLP